MRDGGGGAVGKLPLSEVPYSVLPYLSIRSFTVGELSRTMLCQRSSFISFFFLTP